MEKKGTNKDNILFVYKFLAIKAFSYVKSRSINNIGRVLSDFGKNRPPPPYKGRKPAPKYPPNGSRTYFVLYDDEQEEEGLEDEYPLEEPSESKMSFVKSNAKYSKRSPDGARSSYQHKMSMPHTARKQFRHRALRPARPFAPRKS
jgi:hypothetical protein